MSRIKELTPTLTGNMELARIDLVLSAIHNLQNVITACHGEGEYHTTNFDDKKMRELYYYVNEHACDLYEKQKEVKKELGYDESK